VQSFLIAFVLRLSGLRAVIARCGRLLCTDNFSSLVPALRRGSSLAFVQRLVGVLESEHVERKGDLVAIDGMALSLPKTRRHRCKKMNDKTVGGGVVWAYLIHAAKGVSPVRVLKVVEGAWHDTVAMRTVRLVADGPIYLMDRGFYAFDLLEKWLAEKVHFIVRVRTKDLIYRPIRSISPRRRVDNLNLLLDAVVRLGGAQARLHPTVRLIVALLPSGEKLVLATDLTSWRAEDILAAYKKRWHIERFHRFLKDTLGLSHLYSFAQGGIAFLLYVALLLSLLLLLFDESPSGETIVRVRKLLLAVRAELGLGTPWKRNSCIVSRVGKKRRSR
jgi:hypothetical protein